MNQHVIERFNELATRYGTPTIEATMNSAEFMSNVLAYLVALTEQTERQAAALQRATRLASLGFGEM